MSAHAGVYMIQCIAEGPHRDRHYIGSSRNVRTRWIGHLSSLRRGRHHAKDLQQAFSLYGEQAFTFEVIETVNDEAELLAREQAWIDDTAACGLGFNSSPSAGSTAGRRHTSESRAKMSRAKRGRVGSPVSPEARAKISAANKARPRTPEWLARASIAHLGFKHTPAARAKISAGQGGRRHSAESKLKMAEARRSFWARRKSA